MSDTTSDLVLDEPDPALVRAFNKQFYTGVTVVTTKDGETARGLAVSSYATVSMDPPLIMVCVQRTSSTYPALFAATHLGVNVMANDQRDVVSAFASKSPDKFAGISWREGPHGSPLIDGAAATLEAEIRERFQAKTHTVFICRVRYAVVSEKSPMLYSGGKFFDGASLTELAVQ